MKQTFSRPRSSCAFRPMNRSPSTAPAITLGCLGRPTLRASWPISRVYLCLEDKRLVRRGYAQGRKEAFWVILSSESCLDRPRPVVDYYRLIDENILQEGAFPWPIDVSGGLPWLQRIHCGCACRFCLTSNSLRRCRGEVDEFRAGARARIPWTVSRLSAGKRRGARCANNPVSAMGTYVGMLLHEPAGDLSRQPGPPKYHEM